jgi:hypothetical protein
MVITGGGNVGIGTTSPIAKLSIKGTGNSTGRLLQITDSGDVEKVTILDNGNATFGGVSATGMSSFNNIYPLQVNGGSGVLAGFESGTANYGGNIGSNMFTIYADGSQSITLGKSPVGVHGNGIKNITITNGEGWAWQPTGGSISIYTANMAGNTTPGNVDIYTGTANSVYGNVLLVKNGGNVGIGTTSPLALLDLHKANGDSAIHLSATSSVANFDWTYGIDLSDGGKFKISSSTALGTNDRFAITGDGSVGIGTASPVGKLEIAGGNLSDTSGKAGVVISHGAWADYGIGITLSSLASAGGRDWTLISSNNQLSSRATGSFAIFDSTAEANRFTITTLGDVGINKKDPSSRLEIKGANQLAASSTLSLLDSAGNSLMHVQNNGNVGIGTTTPGMLLDVYGGNARISGSLPYLSFRPTGWSGSSAFIQAGVDATDSTTGDYLAFESSSGKGFTFTSNSAPRLVVDTTGNVGIGTTSPYAKLAITGTGTGTANAFQVTDSANASRFTVLDNGKIAAGLLNAHIYSLDNPSYDDYKSFFNINIATSTNIGITNALKIAGANINGEGGNGMGTAIDFWLEGNGHRMKNAARIDVVWEDSTSATPDASIRFSQAVDGVLTEAMRIDDNGNVGIGTTSPGAKLEIASISTVDAGIKLTAGSSYSSTISFNDDTQNLKIINSGTYSGDDSIYASTRFYTNNDVTTPKMVIQRLGNVGIGTTAPGYKLDVNGVANIRDRLTFATNYNQNHISMQSAGSNWGQIGSPAANTWTLGYAGSDTSTLGTTVLAWNLGNVGIGTTGPNIAGLPAGNTTLTISGTGTTGSEKWGNLEIQGHRIVGGNQVGDIRFFQDATQVAYIEVLNGVSNLDESAMTFFTKKTGVALAEAMRIDKNGNVGIGTTAPNGNLEVKVTNGSGRGLAVRDSGDDSRLQITHDTGYFAIGTTYETTGSYQPIRITPGGNQHLLLQVSGSGNVGIGTTTPATNLDVYYTVNDGTKGLKLGATGLASGYIFADNSLKIGIDNNNDETDKVFQIYKNADPVNSILLTVQESGNVGIGTTSPAAKLQIDVSSATNVTALRLQQDTTVGNGQLTSIDWSGADGAVYNAIGTKYVVAADRMDMQFHSFYNQGTKTPADVIMTLAGNGNLGIGTTSPAESLATAGRLYVGGTGTSTIENNLHVMGTLKVGTGSVYITGNGISSTDGTISVQGGNATSTFSNGIQLSSGCFRLPDGSCAGGGSGGVGASTLVGQMPFYGVVGTNLTATSSMFLTTNGNIGIGTTTPLSRLNVSGISPKIYLSNTSGGLDAKHWFLSNSSGDFSIGTTSDSLATNSTYFTIASSTGYVGIGTAVPSYSLDVAGSVALGSGSEAMRVDSTGNVGIGTSSPYATLSIVNNTGDLTDIFAISTSSSGLIFKVDSYGRTYGDGAYSTPAADYAEYFYTNSVALQSGEVVCIDVVTNNAVKRCERGADNNVMGIVSTKPSVIGNYIKAAENDPAHYTIIGMLGQVDAYVSTENGDINVGDSLTSASSTPGYAMRADGGDSTVAIALESFSGTNPTPASPDASRGGQPPLNLRGGEGGVITGGETATSSVVEGGVISTGKIKVLISRRNKSMAVEEVEALVVERIANMKIEDRVAQLITEGVDKLNLDPKITKIAQEEASKVASSLTLSVNDVKESLSQLQDKIFNDQFSISNQLSSLNGQTNALAESLQALGVSNSRILSVFDISASSTSSPAISVDNLGNIAIGANPSTSSPCGESAQGILPEQGANCAASKARLTVFGLAGSTAPIFNIASSSGESFFQISAFGSVGIGTSTPAAGSALKVAVGGDLGATGFVNLSARSTKKNIEYLTADDYVNVLAKISKNVKVATYQYRSDESYWTYSPSAKRLGLIADEAPLEVLSADGQGVDLYKLASFTLMGVKALASEVDTVKIEVDSLEARIESLEKSSPALLYGKEGANGFQMALETLGGDKIELAPSSIIALSNGLYSSVLNAFKSLGLVVEQGIVRAQKLIADTLQFNKVVVNTAPQTDASGVTKDPTIGNGQINVNELDTYIINNQVSTTTKIFVTPEMPVALGVCETNPEDRTYATNGTNTIETRAQGFRVCMSATSTQIVKFSWWIIETTADSGISPIGQIGPVSPSETPTTTPTPVPEISPIGQIGPIIPSETPVTTPTPSEAPVAATTPAPTPEISPIGQTGPIIPSETPTSTPAPSEPLAPEISPLGQIGPISPSETPTTTLSEAPVPTE